MKSKFRSLLLAAMAVMLFASCSNIASDDATISGDNIRSGECTIKVGIAGAEDFSTARTIRPTTTYTNASSFQKLVLTGTSGKGLSVNHVFTATELAAKEAEISLAYDKWYLTLTAFDGADADSSVAVLAGNYFVDLTNAKPASISFTLTSDDLTTAGSISYTGSIIDPVYSAADDDPMKIVKASAALYSIETDTVIAGTEDNNVAVTTKTLIASNGPNREFTYSKTGVAPGRYVLKITLYSTQGSDASATDTKMGFYSDVVVILPGRATTATETLPDIIGKKPANPLALKVLYVDKSDSDGYYTAKVNWTDNSINEENFILKVSEYNAWNATTETSSIELGAVAGTGKAVFWTSALRKSGTLGASTSSCELKLEAGKLYNFAIAATNSFGTSDFVDRTLCVDADDVAATATAPALIGFQADKVSRIKIEYNLAGGTLELSSTESHEGIYVKYLTYAGSAITLQAGNPATGEVYPKLERSHNPFVEWKNSANTRVETWNSYENLSVTASYNPTFIVSYTVSDSNGELPADSVTATADIGGSSAENCINEVLNLAAAGATNPVFTFTVADAEEIQVRFGSQPARTATGTSLTLDTTGTDVNALEPLEPGTYAVTVLGKVALTGETTAKWYSKVFAVTIQR